VGHARCLAQHPSRLGRPEVPHPPIGSLLGHFWKREVSKEHLQVEDGECRDVQDSPQYCVVGDYAAEVQWNEESSPRGGDRLAEVRYQSFDTVGVIVGDVGKPCWPWLSNTGKLSWLYNRSITVGA
jgi:hypothetical protein